jgi:hypothetical protein
MILNIYGNVKEQTSQEIIEWKKMKVEDLFHQRVRHKATENESVYYWHMDRQIKEPSNKSHTEDQLIYKRYHCQTLRRRVVLRKRSWISRMSEENMILIPYWHHINVNLDCGLNLKRKAVKILKDGILDYVNLIAAKTSNKYESVFKLY